MTLQKIFSSPHLIFILFLKRTIFKVLTEFVTILLLFYVLGLFASQACGILALQPGIKSSPPAMEGEALTHWTSREVLAPYFIKFYFLISQSCLTNLGLLYAILYWFLSFHKLSLIVSSALLCLRSRDCISRWFIISTVIKLVACIL